MSNYVINLTPLKGEVESYEEKDENVLMVRIQLPTGEMISGHDYRVEMSLSKDAMLALGISMIRAAHNEKDFWHLHPVYPELISQYFGVFLHPESCELLISEKGFGNIHKVVSEVFKDI